MQLPYRSYRPCRAIPKAELALDRNAKELLEEIPVCGCSYEIIRGLLDTQEIT